MFTLICFQIIKSAANVHRSRQIIFVSFTMIVKHPHVLHVLQYLSMTEISLQIMEELQINLVHLVIVLRGVYLD